MEPYLHSSSFKFDHTILRDLIHGKVQLVKYLPKIPEITEEYVIALDCSCLICHGEGHLRFLTNEEEKIVTSQKIAYTTNRPFLICKNCYQIALKHLVEVTKKADHFQRIIEQVTEIIISIQNLTKAKEGNFTTLEAVELPKPIQMHQVVAKYEEVFPSSDYLDDCNQLDMSDDDFVFTDDENSDMETDEEKISPVSIPCVTEDKERFFKNAAETNKDDSNNADSVAENTFAFANVEFPEDPILDTGNSHQKLLTTMKNETQQMERVDSTTSSSGEGNQGIKRKSIIRAETIVGNLVTSKGFGSSVGDNNSGNENFHDIISDSDESLADEAMETYYDKIDDKHDINQPELNRNTCPECGNRYSRKSGLKRHFIRQHEGLDENKTASGIKCPECEKFFIQQKAVQFHIELTHKSKMPTEHTGPNRCPECGQCYKVKLDLLTHFKDSHEGKIEGNNVCEICQNAFQTERGMAIHVKMAHSVITQKTLCLECGKEYSTRGGLTRHHLLRHESSGETDYDGHQCLKCDKTFRHEATLQIHNHYMHTTNALEPSNFSCSNCSEVFDSYSSLFTHRNKVTRKRLNCPECGKCHRKRQDLHLHFSEIHKRSENGRLACPTCQNPFKTERGRTLHFQIVHGKQKQKYPQDLRSLEGVTKCLECEKYFISSNALKMHHLNFHENCVETSPQRHKCPQCESTFKHEGTIQTHISCMHSRTGRTNVQKCSATLGNYRSLQIPKQTNCGNGINCPECKTNYKTTRHFVGHFQMKHEGRLEGAYTCDICDTIYIPHGEGESNTPFYDS